jgi:ribosome biogenesis GTPase A
MKDLLNDIQIVSEIVADLTGSNFIIELNELKQKLEENKFYLVVTGLFKRGKSSIINTLIGKNIAPLL